MRFRFILIFATLLLILATAAFSAPRQMPIQLCDRCPALRGDMSCYVWLLGSLADKFTTLKSGTEPEAATEAYVVWDEECLSVAFVCHEPNMDKLVANVESRDGRVWDDDCVEIMLDPTGSGAWMYHIIINPNGAIFDTIHSIYGAAPEFNADIKVKTGRADDQWLCEVTIPFSELACSPQPGEVWGINFGRERKAGKSEVTAWSPCDGFTDSTQLGDLSFGQISEPIKLSILSRGGASVGLNEYDVNHFAVMAENTSGKAADVRLSVLHDGVEIQTAKATLNAGEQRALKATYAVPEPATAILGFRASVNGEAVYATNMLSLVTTASPVRTWQVEDPLFKELLGTERPAKDRPGAIMWTHLFNRSLLQETAKRFAVRYSGVEATRYFGNEKLIAVGGGIVTGDEAALRGRYVVKNVAYPKGSNAEIPWNLDPAAMDYFCQQVEDMLSQPHPLLWGIMAGDEEDEAALRKGVELMADPPEGYEYIKIADAEVKAKYGGGTWGIPVGMDDRNPYRWIAYHKWALERLRTRHARMVEIMRKYDPDMVIVSTDPVSGIHGYEYSRQAEYFDVFTHQYLPRQKRWRAYMGFLSKVLADLTGKEAWPCVHIENYGMATTPQECVEEMSQVFRNGGTGFHLYMPDTAFGSKLVGDTRVTMFGSPRRFHTVNNIMSLARRMPKPALPSYTRAAVLYNDDCLQSESYKAGRTYWYDTEACYTFIGPIARSWFKFIDCPQVLEKDLNAEFDTIWLPTARYQQPEIVAKLRQFVENGGTLICGDPNAFATDTIGNDTTASREEIFGAKTGDSITIKEIALALPGMEARTLPMAGKARKLTILDGAEAVASFDDGSPAIVMNRLGKGRAYLWAISPFTFELNEDAQWQQAFTDMVASLGAPTGLDIWRFRFPDSVIWEEITPKGVCLTNNNVRWEEEQPKFPYNFNTGGSYRYVTAPDWMADFDGENGWIPFGTGKLTDRRTSIQAEKTEASWYMPYKEPASRWNVGWKQTAPVTIEFDLKQACAVNAVKLWVHRTAGPVEVEGSVDGENWTRLGGRKSMLDAGVEVLDTCVPLRDDVPSRYVKVTIGERPDGEYLSLIEAEVWGEPLE